MRRCRTCGDEKPTEAFPIREGAVRRPHCRDCYNRARAARSKPEEPFKTPPKKNRRYIITWAQNATPPHQGFLDTLKTYCKHTGSTLIVIPGRYKNPTSQWTEKNQDAEWWHASLVPYLYAGRRQVGDHLTIYGDITIQPTATRPLTGMEIFATRSAIFGHPKVQLRTVPSGKRYYPRILTSTGAITLPNYTRSKAGKKGEAHHTLAATIVEEGDLFHVRQVTANADGSFIDLDTWYHPDSVQKAPRAPAIVFGDIHESMSVDSVIQATFEGPDSIVGTLNPEKGYIHDLLHWGDRNRHSHDAYNTRYDLLQNTKRACGASEVMAAIRFLDELPGDLEPVVVASNHDDMLDWWLRNVDIKQDLVNAKFFHEAWAMVLEKREADGFWTPAFRTLYDAHSEKHRARFLERDAPESVKGIHLGFHGDLGTNGSKGSPLSYSRLGVRATIGHVHSPEILETVFAVGVTGSLDQGYNRGPTGWLNTHSPIYADGHRTLIHVIDGSWRLKD